MGFTFDGVDDARAHRPLDSAGGGVRTYRTSVVNAVSLDVLATLITVQSDATVIEMVLGLQAALQEFVLTTLDEAGLVVRKGPAA